MTSLVERRAESISNVESNSRESFWEGLSLDDLVDICMCLCIKLNDRGVGIRLRKTFPFGLKLGHAMLGMIDLIPGIVEGF
jgi:hypothetical protein